MSVDVKAMAAPGFKTGRFTSASSAADVTETVGFPPTIIIAWIDTSGTSPNMLVKVASETDETMLTTGTTGVVTTPADSSGITVSGNTFTIESGAQVNDGLNTWIAFR